MKTTQGLCSHAIPAPCNMTTTPCKLEDLYNMPMGTFFITKRHSGYLSPIYVKLPSTDNCGVRYMEISTIINAWQRDRQDAIATLHRLIREEWDWFMNEHPTMVLTDPMRLLITNGIAVVDNDVAITQIKRGFTSAYFI